MEKIKFDHRENQKQVTHQEEKMREKTSNLPLKTTGDRNTTKSLNKLKQKQA